MLGRKLLALFSLLVATQVGFAGNDTMSRSEWFGKLKSTVPELICRGFLKDKSLSEQMKKKSIDYNKCMAVLPESFDKCQKEIESQVPETIDAKGSETWGNKLGECIGKDFAVKHLI